MVMNITLHDEGMNRNDEWISMEWYTWVIWSLCAVSTIITMLRLYSRHFILNAFNWDDGLICIVVVAAIADTSVVYESIHFGLGQNISEVPNSYLPTFYKLLYAQILLYLLAIHTLRASLVIWYRSLSVSDNFHMICWVYLAINGALFVIFGVTKILQCGPIAESTTKLNSTECVNASLLFIFGSVALVILDAVALLLPVSAVFKMKLPLKQKMVFVPLLGLGILSFVSGVWRMIFTIEFDAANVTQAVAKSHLWAFCISSNGKAAIKTLLAWQAA
ncbi:Similar to hypothetical protein ASPNIDRAFT_174228 [Aspergillus niger ATCC 1015]; acc. no. EHA22556 [Pyronema omphalodes CBS 100304]|uniref:Rhodopsin domain-containing protein n=1 Tax=Pyronema omphalodes (strain CBS 100304) TaxID=1076935 RepID=U4LLS7_PYROM|nr:Similar to hypothetical protein ASPNIDRAFT_174228 [Aspergillus niger ATCC 1015]; acc. no. EHA22556 [Pyronema omphalodes CBS 100304]